MNRSVIEQERIYYVLIDLYTGMYLCDDGDYYLSNPCDEGFDINVCMFPYMSPCKKLQKELKAEHADWNLRVFRKVEKLEYRD